jgi:acetate kinase
VTEKFGFRKYGFHGLSYSYVTRAAARFLTTPLENLRIVACHLGTGGSSVAAVKNGHSVDTSMGYSPLPGLVMSTRSGDIDPFLTLYLMSLYGYRPDDLLDILNKQSGLLGLSGFSSDIRDIIRRISEQGEGQAELAFAMYVHRLKKYIGSYVLALAGLDCLVFTDDIGLHNPLVREKVCDNMEWCGIVLDSDANQHAVGDNISRLSPDGSSVQVLAIPTEEEQVIATEGARLLGGKAA